MCLAVPGKIVAIKDDMATLDYRTEKRRAKLLEDSYAVGDYAIVQGGCVIMKVEKQEAKEALDLYEEAVK